MDSNAIINEIVELLSTDELTVLLDTIRFGAWGDTAMEFLNKDGNVETVMAYGYCTNDAHLGGHFNGRKISALFRSMFRKLCPDRGMGRYLSHCSDWWGDGSGDMLFVRTGLYDELEKYAENRSTLKS